MSDLLTIMSSILTFIFSMFGDILGTITDIPLLFLPVLLGVLGTVIFFAIRILRKLGVRSRR